MDKESFILHLNQTVARTTTEDIGERCAAIGGRWGSWIAENDKVQFTLLWAAQKLRNHEQQPVMPICPVQYL